MAKKQSAGKTNAMRLLERLRLPYECRSYEGGKLDALRVAEHLAAPPAAVLKTLVTRGRSGAHYVFLLPAAATLDLKRAAGLTGEKSLEMLPQKELLPLTGYMAGGCSPIGMKQCFPTFMEESAAARERIFISAGRIGTQLALSPQILMQAVPIRLARLAAETGEA